MYTEKKLVLNQDRYSLYKQEYCNFLNPLSVLFHFENVLNYF